MMMAAPLPASSRSRCAIKPVNILAREVLIRASLLLLATEKEDNDADKGVPNGGDNCNSNDLGGALTLTMMMTSSSFLSQLERYLDILLPPLVKEE